MLKNKSFNGVRGTPSMKVRGGGSNELERYRVQKLAKPLPGNFALVPAQAACDRSLGRVTPLHVLTLLAKYRDAKTGKCVVRMKRLASELGISRRMVQLHINKLVNMGFLVVIPQRQRAGGYAANCYMLLYPSFTKSKDPAGSNLHDDCQDDYISLAKEGIA